MLEEVLLQLNNLKYYYENIQTSKYYSVDDLKKYRVEKHDRFGFYNSRRNNRDDMDSIPRIQTKQDL